MGQENNTKYQPEFGKFVQTCVIDKGTLLTKTDKLFTKDNIEITRDFLTLFDESNKDAKQKKEKTWGIGDIFDGSVFGDGFKNLVKNNKQYNFKEKEGIIIEILLHCNWLMYLCSDRQHKQDKALGYYKEGIDNYFNANTEWAIGPTFSGISLDAMLFILELILEVQPEESKIKTIEETINEIENSCNDDDWKNNSLKWDDGTKISSDAIVNVILFFCDTTKYLPIPAQNKKELISKKLGDFIDENEQNLPEGWNDMSETDKKLYLIRKKLRELNVEYCKKANPFWHSTILPFWDDSTENLDKDQLSDKTLLEYKKAMILYGPPGTSKSYQARKMAEGMIAEALRNQHKNDISTAIANFPATIDSHIHILQMHPNYTYDDFIIGKSIEDNKIVVKPGKILQIIKGIKDDKIPHFVILDEINRVDISRVFGELFTAMETSYRDKGVELSVNINDIPKEEREGLHIEHGKLYLKVPQNMYFIGTMNMIDFSLEQVDFALRRRFLWRLSTYDQKRLDEIISEKVKNEIDKIEKNHSNLNEKAVLRDCPDNFSKTCTDLNNEIEWENSLGKSYLIGHAFFSEIVDIVKQVKDWDKAKNILWQVSILPTLEAYCGTMDANMQEDFLNKCKNAFIPKPKEEKKK